MKYRLLWLLGLLVPAALIASLWVPLLGHYWVASPTIEPSKQDRLRTLPSERRLIAIEQHNLALPLRMSDSEILEAAARFQTGELLLKGFPVIKVAPGFDRLDLRKGLPTWGLHFGGLAGAEILAKAYEISGDDRWLSAALHHALGFIEHERSAWIPDGFLWNDHAISARVSTLIKVWRLYRKHREYDPDNGRRILEHILRCRNLLAKASQFTFSTNHGVMQNLSLLQIAAAFPGLPNEERFLMLARERLIQQMRFYVSPEGVILEHSAEYHGLGVELISMATSLLEMLGQSVPPLWTVRLGQAQDFLDLIRLPDGSLPMFGNTHSTPDFSPQGRTQSSDERPACKKREGVHLFPVAGYVVGWSCRGYSTQSVMALSQFVGHGHKHADELSLQTWTRGGRWLTSVGYWPYGIAGDEQAYGWYSSNAPHWRSERTAGEREPMLVASGTTATINFLDARRSGPSGSEFRRQVLQIGSDWWIVLDFAFGQANAEAEVLWMFYPDISLVPRSGGGYLAKRGLSEMLVNVTGSGIDHRIVVGERSPWRGWVVRDRVPQPATALLANFPANSLMVSSFRMADRGKSNSIEIEVLAYQGPEAWELAVKTGGHRKATIARRPEGIVDLAGLDHLGSTSLALTSAADIRAERATIHAAYAELAAKYPRYREFFHYRIKTTKHLLALLAAQEMFLALVWIFRRRHLMVMRMCHIVAWVGGGLALHLWYFT